MKKAYLEPTVILKKQALTSLARAISLPRQRFSLILVHCNQKSTQKDALQILQEQYLNKGQCLYLSESTISLYDEIQKQCQTAQPHNLMIFDLESVLYLDPLILAFNQMRNEFKRKFHFPIVLWLNDETTQKLIKLAPDFYNWASPPIHLD